MKVVLRLDAQLSMKTMTQLMLDHHGLWALVLVQVPTYLERSVSSSNVGCQDVEVQVGKR